MGVEAADYSPSQQVWDELKRQIPGITEQELNLLLPQIVGELTPEMESYIDAGETAMAGIEADPRLRNAQLSALDYLSEIGETGLTAADRAAMSEIRRNTQSDAQAKQAQIIQDMAQRGTGGSGAELAARLSGSQAASDRMSRESDALIQQAQNRALQGITQSAGLAGEMRGQDFNQAGQIASARDAMNRFNTQNQQSLQQRNVGARNQAQLQNLQERQRVADAATGLKNQQQQYNKNLLQQQFQNRALVTQGRAGLASQQAQASQQADAATKGALYGTIGSAIGGAMMLSDEDMKKDIKKTTGELRKLLNNLESYTYRYKDKADQPEGVHAGIMAQELEEAGPLGANLVVDTPEGKKVDTTQGFGTMMAAVVDMNKRLNKIEGNE